MQHTLFIDVILPLPLNRLFTYRVPREWQDLICVGQRVVVQFGKNKLYTAIVYRMHDKPPQAYEAKYIENILDEQAIITAPQLKLWEWMADYYLCALGEVMNAALPSGLKLSSETKIILNAAFSEPDLLSDKEYLIYEALLIHNVLSMQEVAEILELKQVHRIIKSMLDKSAIRIQEELKEKYKPLYHVYVRLNAAYKDETLLRELFEKLEKRAAKQLEVLMAFLHHSKFLSDNPVELKKAFIEEQVEGSDAAIKALAKKNVFEIYKVEVGRIAHHETELATSIVFSEHQQRAFNEINQHFTDKEVVLLHGVTSSGKTEIYIRLIEEALKKEKQVLYLLPEIALTAQIINRLRKHFGNTVGVYHSKYNENERVEIWNNVLQQATANKHSLQEPYKVILGARSAMFLPFSNLGLVIVDEEHENSYKQYEPAPRYHARDAALVLASLHKAKTLLGSATPAIETYFNAQSGKYALVEIFERYGGVQMPEILIADIKEDTRKKKMHGFFTYMLYDAMEDALKNKQQVILFQNRRGYAPVYQCQSCGWVPMCKSCDVSLTYHKVQHKLICHYCGYNEIVPNKCGACGSSDIRMKGFGTERIEDELSIMFPTAKIARLDLDTSRSKNAHRQIISDLEEQRIDILVGTQMVTKGLDFDNVALVGILNADTLLNYPDFRSYERSFQLMAQVAGRAGRKNKRGKVIVQTWQPQHPVIEQVVANNYFGMYTTELNQRLEFKYPPYYKLIQLTLKHKEVEPLNEAAKYFAQKLREKFGKRILGPEFPAVARIRNYYLKNILIKIEREASAKQAKTTINELIDNFYAEPDFKTVKIITDTDPM
jgi:primosomal protein N' (replication factor Y) (superfamily II helicase)